MNNLADKLIFSLRRFFFKWQRDIDIGTFRLLFCLILIGIVAVSTSGVAMASRINLPYFFFLKRHLLFCAIALLVIFIVSALETRVLFNFCKISFIVLLILLFYVSFFGSEVKGSKRWLNLVFITIQPSDLMKPFFITLNGILISKNNLHTFRLILSFFLIFIIVILLISQPDVGMTLIFLSIFLVQIFFSKLPKEVFILSPVFFPVLFVFFYKKFDYIKKRIDIFFEDGVGYQTMQSINSIKNGGFFGQGFGNGEYKYKLPDSSTDYIFSVLCEEFGYIGIIVLFLLYVKIFQRLFVAVKNLLNRDLERFIIAIGLFSVFFIQTFVNIGVAINLLPSKGMTLPFISYGGSSMLSNALIFGMILNLTRKEYSFKEKLT